MIEQLREFYDKAGEIVAPYEEDQKELYDKANKEFVEESNNLGLKHHTPEFVELRDRIWKKYKGKGLKVDFIGCNNPNWSNFSSVAAKHFLTGKGFHVLVTGEDFALLLDRETRRYSEGFKIICDIFGEMKVKELLDKVASNGGEPDLFVYLDQDPNNAWFVEVKKRGERLTRTQMKHFPLIQNILCPVEILRLVPSNDLKSSSSQGRKRTINGRDWTDEEIENAFTSSDDPIARDLYLFARQYSYKGQLTAPGRKVKPSFGFYIRGYHSDGSDYTVQAFNWVEGRGFLKLYLKATVTVAPESVSEEYKKGLIELFGKAVDLSVPEHSITITAIDEKLKEFKALILKLQRDIEAKVES